ncbi:hypothetical protein VNI00_011230 [Paramarasmius palmivorus]|uniref:Uncharacterized protein n=1 Tax=Paramarasmius palmivorus TaxID=297713 RepID=A0AAW0CFM5_9AGAR
MATTTEVRDLGAKSLQALYTLYLFTKSDTILVVVPSLIVAMVAAGPADLVTVFHALLWMELHLLAFNIKNQTIGIEEDKLCKPHRPFASGRVSLEYALLMYIIAVAVAVSFSFYHGLQLLSLTYFLGTTAYNEFGLAKSLILKSPMGAWGYMCYCWGPTYIIGGHQPLSTTSVHGIAASVVIFALTGHAQDFRDRSGDAVMGRKTIPLAFPQWVSRGYLITAMAGLTYGLSKRWSPPPVVAGVFALLCLITAIKFSLKRTEEDDRKSFRWYELWLICAHLLPVFERRQAWNID